MTILLRDAHKHDATDICLIYNPYVLTTTISFETEAVSEEEMSQRITAVNEKGLPWIVALENNVVIAYAYASPWRVRNAYRFSVESTVYVDSNYHGKGIGRMVYSALIDILKVRGVHSVMGGIALPNDASIGLHESLGFKRVACFEDAGYKFGKWVSTGYWQLIL